MNSAQAHDGGRADYIVYKTERWSYDEFCAESNRLARALSDILHVRPGDRVAVAMRNYPELLILMTAISSIGAVVVFLNAWWTRDELEYALTDSGAKIVFADSERCQRIAASKEQHGRTIVAVRASAGATPLRYENLLSGVGGAQWPDVRINADDDFAIMYSSGTTGRPKGVILTHRGAISAVFTWLMSFSLPALMLPVGADPLPAPKPQSVLVVTPLFHVTATHPVFLLSQPMGAKLVLMYKWDADEAARLIQRENISRFIGVPTQSFELMQAAEKSGARLDCLEYIGAGGAKRPASQVAGLARAFPNAAIASGWGMTETNAVGIGISGPDYVQKPGSAGRLLPPLQDIKIVDERGDDVPLGTLGEIIVKSAANMRGYLNQPKATCDVLRDGWLKTGDLGTLDADGFVTILDRKKNIVIRGGENIACLDVEGALHKHPAVIEATAFAVADPRLGEVVGAAIQIARDQMIDLADMRAFLQPHLAPFKIPDHLWVQTTPLLRGATEKIDRRAIRAACLKARDHDADT